MTDADTNQRRTPPAVTCLPVSPDGRAGLDDIMLENAAVQVAGETFRFYEQHHAAKGTVESDAKARANARLAEMCERALTFTLEMHELDPPPATFRDDLQRCINRWSRENGSNTPDYCLADFVIDSLIALDGAILNRDAHLGRRTTPKEPAMNDDTPATETQRNAYYIGVKCVGASPLYEADAIEQGIARGEPIQPSPSDPTGQGRAGYRVCYGDNYVSWSPASVFEGDYVEVPREDAPQILLATREELDRLAAGGLIHDAIEAQDNERRARDIRETAVHLAQNLLPFTGDDTAPASRLKQVFDTASKIANYIESGVAVLPDPVVEEAGFIGESIPLYQISGPDLGELQTLLADVAAVSGALAPDIYERIEKACAVLRESRFERDGYPVEAEPVDEAARAEDAQPARQAGFTIGSGLLGGENEEASLANGPQDC